MIDTAKINVRAGNGGDGAIAFRHEKSIAEGGPYGGNGGKGGSIWIVASKDIDSLRLFSSWNHFVAEDGENGKSKLCNGRDAKDVVIQVPVGTVITSTDGEILCDLDNDGDQFLAAKGGRGGRGNANFKSPKRRTPKVAENGFPGEQRWLLLELKLLADVGLLGLPNAGKSTLINAMTNASSIIGDYPFTTTEAVLGVCILASDKRFVLADVPGIIENASQGRGMGLTFLRHLERSAILLHVVDITSEDPYNDYLTIRNEALAYSDDMKSKKSIVVLNKVDQLEDRSKIDEFKEKIGPGTEIYEISALEKTGIEALENRLYEAVSEYKAVKAEKIKEEREEKVIRADYSETSKIPDYKIVRVDEGYFEIIGERVVRTKRIMNLSTDEGMDRLLAYLDRIGIEERLIEAGVEDGDTVVLDGFEFEYHR